MRTGTVGFYGPSEVDVALGKMTKVEWKCDSGEMTAESDDQRALIARPAV